MQLKFSFFSSCFYVKIEVWLPKTPCVLIQLTNAKPCHKLTKMRSCQVEFCRSFNTPTRRHQGQSFRDVKMTFSSIPLISRFEISACPLVWGWYSMAILWVTPYFLSRFSNCHSMKCDPPSLITSLGTLNFGKNNRFEELNHCFGIICWGWQDFNPFGDIVHS